MPPSSRMPLVHTQTHTRTTHVSHRALWQGVSLGKYIPGMKWDGYRFPPWSFHSVSPNCFHFCLVSSGVFFTTLFHYQKILSWLCWGFIHFLLQFYGLAKFLYKREGSTSLSMLFDSRNLLSVQEKSVDSLGLKYSFLYLNSQPQIQIPRCISIWHDASVSMRITKLGLWQKVNRLKLQSCPCPQWSAVMLSLV